jgi:hypothetical protein
MVGKRRGGPWYGNERALVLFERGVRKAYPGLKQARRIRPEGLVYEGELPVTGYPSRQVSLLFPKGLTPESVRVKADGPAESPHRFSDESLCIWYPKDGPERKWVHSDGLVALLDLVSVHLFKEAYWRETDVWLGEEAPHIPNQMSKSRALQDTRTSK